MSETKTIYQQEAERRHRQQLAIRYCEVVSAAIHQNFEKVDFELYAAALGELLKEALNHLPHSSRVEIANAVQRERSTY